MIAPYTQRLNQIDCIHAKITEALEFVISDADYRSSALNWSRLLRIGNLCKNKFENLSNLYSNSKCFTYENPFKIKLLQLLERLDLIVFTTIGDSTAANFVSLRVFNQNQNFFSTIDELLSFMKVCKDLSVIPVSRNLKGTYES